MGPRLKFATLAVIGTLRPTDRRRAFICLARNIPFPTQIYHANGAEGDRTPDLCSAIAALSQLSYSPETPCACAAGEAVNLARISASIKQTTMAMTGNTTRGTDV